MSTLVFLLEEESAKNMLIPVVKKLVPEEIPVQFITFSGKQDMERQMVKKIRYWCAPGSRFIIMRDKDSGDCGVIKQRLLALAQESGKGEACLVRIACHELESFFLGDLAAMAQGLNVPTVATMREKQKFRAPDALANAAEELKKLTEGKYSKLAGSRAIGPHLKLDGSNRSHSFGVLLEAIRRQVALIVQANTLPEG